MIINHHHDHIGFVLGPAPVIKMWEAIVMLAATFE
jgi:hypothetical protein